MQNKVIINADDFGLSESSSKAIAKAFDENLISSTTAMANGEYIEEAFKLAVKGGFVDKVGIHIVLTEGVPLTDGIKSDEFFCEKGVFHDKINRLKKPNKTQLQHLRKEVTAQIEKLRKIGFPLSHADSHHHIHTDVFFIKSIEDVLKEYGINKIRLHRNFGKIIFYKKIVKNIYNDKLRKNGFLTAEKMGSLEDVEEYPDIIKKSFCEIMVHPDFDKSGQLIDRTSFESDIPIGKELSRIREYIEGLQLVSYKEV